MQLSQTLSETMAALRRELRAPFRALYDDLVTRLTDTATAEGALKQGDVFPEFALPDQDGKFVLSSDLLKSGPLVVNFYRGRWCPFCSATVVGVSPEVEHLPFSASRKRDLNFKMLSDLDNGLALQCGLLFRLTDEIIRQYRADGLDLAKVYGNGSWFLPIPATYIVLPNGSIGRAYVNPDFRYRMEPQDIIHSVGEFRPR